MNIHIAVKLHMLSDCFTYIVFNQLIIFILKNITSAFVRHNVRYFRIIRFIALIHSSIDFNITVIVIASLVIAYKINFSILIYIVDILVCLI